MGGEMKKDADEAGKMMRPRFEKMKMSDLL